MVYRIPILAGAALALDDILPNTDKRVKSLIVLGLFFLFTLSIVLSKEDTIDRLFPILGLIVGYYFGQKELTVRTLQEPKQ